MNLGWGALEYFNLQHISHALSRSMNVHSAHGPVVNPINLSERRSAGGSSGGSAAAVAAGMCDA